MAHLPTISHIRAEKSQTLDEFAAAVGIKSKSHASMIENGHREPSPEVALAIEAWSGGRIPAGTLSRDVAVVDEARGRLVHTANNAAIEWPPSGGKAEDFSAPAERQAA